MKYIFWTVSLKLFLCHPLCWMECPDFYGVHGLRLCPSQWRGGLVYEGTDKGSFDDVTSFIVRRHQINLCLSLLKIYGPSSSTSTTSSSLSTATQRKSAQQPTNGIVWLVWYAKQLRGFYWCIILALWYLMKMPYCYTVTQRLLLSNPVSHCCFVVEEQSKKKQVL